jgi:hypothetical protein
MREQLTDWHAVVFARTLVALVLLAAGLAKLVSWREFIEVVRNYEILPAGVSGLVGWLLPPAEIIVATGMLVGLLMPWSAFAAMLLFLLFGSAMAINLLRGRRDISCGCFGPQRDHRLTWGLVIRNAMLAGLAAVPWLVGSTQEHGKPLPAAEVVATMLAAGSVFALWWLWGVILKTWRLADDARHRSHVAQTFESVVGPGKRQAGKPALPARNRNHKALYIRHEVI